VRQLYDIVVIGIGTGNPQHMTLEAIATLQAADIVLVPDKGDEKAALLAARREIVARHGAPDRQRVVTYAMPQRDADAAYRDAVDEWHAEIAHRIETALTANLAPGQTAAFLVWGDPGLYDSLLRILDRVGARNIRVVPGISSLAALTAAFAIPLNRIGAPVTITPARQLVVPHPPADTVVVLDGRQRFREVDGSAYDIFWGAYLGLPYQILVSGLLADVADRISALRAEARARHGWIMDIYLLRRRDSAHAED
jgi:precorrin-6A synthase